MNGDRVPAGAGPAGAALAGGAVAPAGGGVGAAPGGGGPAGGLAGAAHAEGGGPAGGGAVIRVVLPHHLRTLAGARGEVRLTLESAGPAAPVSQSWVIDALESRYPTLRGTIRDPATMRRRPFIRFYAGGEDLSHQPPDAPLPDPVLRGDEAFHVVGAMAGG